MFCLGSWNRTVVLPVFVFCFSFDVVQSATYVHCFRFSIVTVLGQEPMSTLVRTSGSIYMTMLEFSIQSIFAENYKYILLFTSLISTLKGWVRQEKPSAM